MYGPNVRDFCPARCPNWPLSAHPRDVRVVCTGRNDTKPLQKQVHSGIQPYYHVFCPTSSRITAKFQYTDHHFSAQNLRIFCVLLKKRGTLTQKGVHFAVKTSSNLLLTLERLGQGYGIGYYGCCVVPQPRGPAGPPRIPLPSRPHTARVVAGMNGARRWGRTDAWYGSGCHPQGAPSAPYPEPHSPHGLA